MKIVKLCCPICRRELSDYHEVQLDDLNTVTHLWCNKDGENSLLPIKDRGVFNELKKKYAF